MITPTTLTKTQFIGFELALSPKNKGALVCPIIRDCTVSSVRVSAQISRPQILPPITNIVAKLESTGYCKNRIKVTPTRVGRLIQLTLPMIIEHYKS